MVMGPSKWGGHLRRRLPQGKQSQRWKEVLSLMTSLSSQTRQTQSWLTHSLAFSYIKPKGDGSVLAS